MHPTRAVTLRLNRQVREALTDLAAKPIKPLDEIGWIARAFTCSREAAVRLIRNARK